MGGAFFTNREIFNHAIWNNIIEFRLFFLIYGNAVFLDKGLTIGDIHLKRGQWLRSQRNISKDLEYVENNSVKHYSISSINRAIDSLANKGCIEYETCKLGTIFTVINYEKYQRFPNYKYDNVEFRENSERTSNEHQQNNNKEVNKDNKRYKHHNTKTKPEQKEGRQVFTGKANRFF